MTAFVFFYFQIGWEGRGGLMVTLLD